MARVDPSKFLQVFRFEKFNKSANSSAGNNEAFEQIYNTRGQWEFIKGDRSLDNGIDRIASQYRATFYWRSALETVLTKDTRLIYENLVYTIETIQRVGEQRQYYQFTVIEAH